MNCLNDSGVILHEENIGLINDYEEQLGRCNIPWTHCDIFQRGGYNGWVEHSKSGIPFVRSISMVEAVCHLCGDVKAVGGAWSEAETSFEAVAKLETSDKKRLPLQLIDTKILREERSLSLSNYRMGVTSSSNRQKHRELNQACSWKTSTCLWRKLTVVK
ncbi:uncharacterized protein LOC125658689 [Ostrea edulis]|uniref:uncharacterized protein LOC125658689 n=1 Tax=Ostrea edulis TaxID=37623 RepID=UPI0024AF1EE1|nr:uncharacterized protein LOC125658689 [Ostrea edulis]